MNDILEKKVEKFLSKIDLQEYSIKALLVLFAESEQDEIIKIKYHAEYEEAKFYQNGTELEFFDSIQGKYFVYDGEIGKISYLTDNVNSSPVYGFVYIDTLEVLEINSSITVKKLT